MYQQIMQMKPAAKTKPKAKAKPKTMTANKGGMPKKKKGMAKGGKTMSLSAVRAAAKKLGYKLVKMA